MRHPGESARALLLAALVALAACNGSDAATRAGSGNDGGGDEAGDGSAQPGSATSRGSSAPVMYLALERPGWALSEAIDYRAGLGRLEDFEPDLDWFAEYDGPRTDGEGGTFVIPSVSISAHTVGLDRRREQMSHLSFEPAEVPGRKALAGAGANGPRMIILELGADYSVELLSYDLQLGALRELAGHLQPVDEQAWVDHGGVLLDCVPFEPGCQGPDD